jgi:hypothetical protein
MKRIFLVAVMSLSILCSNAQQLSFTDSTVISLITCSPGKEVYEKFGHTGIRIKDKKNGNDLIFNYGIFSFETENFYYKFIKGETDYQLGLYYTGNFLPAYAERNSVVWEQVLNLTVDERRKLIKLLLENYEPENRTYRYNFVFDNCATRPRDKILSALNGYVKLESNNEPKTFRQWIGMYVGTDTWLKFGIDLVFGMDADSFASPSQSMFLPEALMTEFQQAQIYLPNGQTKKLVSDKNILVNKNAVSGTTSGWSIKPLTVSLILLIIGTLITIWDLFRRRHYKLFDSFLYIVTGLGGLIAAYLMFFSTHPLVKMNLNLLWLNPLNLVVGILMWNRKLRIPLFFYQFLNIMFLVGALIAFALSVQIFNIAVFPIIVLMLMRSTSWVAYLKRRIYKHKSGLKG